ncbi:hypothetical protein B0H12DRAFT_1100779, partial [Mycena haematopus]
NAVKPEDTNTDTPPVQQELSPRSPQARNPRRGVAWPGRPTVSRVSRTRKKPATGVCEAQAPNCQGSFYHTADLNQLWY